MAVYLNSSPEKNVSVLELKTIHDIGSKRDYIQGEVRNDTKNCVRNVRVSYRIIEEDRDTNNPIIREKTLNTGSIQVTNTAFEPGKVATFKREVTLKGTPKITKIEWINENGSYSYTTL